MFHPKFDQKIIFICFQKINFPSDKGHYCNLQKEPQYNSNFWCVSLTLWKVAIIFLLSNAFWLFSEIAIMTIFRGFIKRKLISRDQLKDYGWPMGTLIYSKSVTTHSLRKQKNSIEKLTELIKQYLNNKGLKKAQIR